VRDCSQPPPRPRLALLNRTFGAQTPLLPERRSPGGCSGSGWGSGGKPCPGRPLDPVHPRFCPQVCSRTVDRGGYRPWGEGLTGRGACPHPLSHQVAILANPHPARPAASSPARRGTTYLPLEDQSLSIARYAGLHCLPHRALPVQTPTPRDAITSRIQER